MGFSHRWPSCPVGHRPGTGPLPRSTPRPPAPSSVQRGRATGLRLADLPTMPSPTRRDVVEVNECRVFATTSGTAWWSGFTQLHAHRLDRVFVSLGGDLVHVACDDRAHADWLAGHMVTFGGLPKSAVKTRRV